MLALPCVSVTRNHVLETGSRVGDTVLEGVAPYVLRLGVCFGEQTFSLVYSRV